MPKPMLFPLTSDAQPKALPREDPRVNRILKSLPQSEWERLRPFATIRTVKYAELLFAHYEPADFTYFPLTCMISMIAEMANGEECEYGCIGREGMLGLQVALGAQPLRGRALCQIEGQAVRFDGAILRKLTASGEAPTLHAVLLRYAQATINTLAQAAACNALHSIKQRTCRWLLLSRDRAGCDEFALTQEFLSKMLGVRRASVTHVAGLLQRSKIISYGKGHIKILQASVLEEQSCECYGVIRDEYESVFAF